MEKKKTVTRYPVGDRKYKEFFRTEEEFYCQQKKEQISILTTQFYFLPTTNDYLDLSIINNNALWINYSNEYYIGPDYLTPGPKTHLPARISDSGMSIKKT